jgi:uncharacterized membrane protein YphA (DoxX/SURF4 family)
MKVRFFRNKYFLVFVRLVLGFVFIYSGIEKISDLNSFAIAVTNYKMLPGYLVNLFAIFLPWIELSAGLLLLFGIAVKENAFIINSFLIVFIFAIGISIARGLNIDCGCFGTQSSSKVGFIKLVENLLLFLIGLPLIFFGSDYLSLKEKSKTI